MKRTTQTLASRFQINTPSLVGGVVVYRLASRKTRLEVD